MSNYAELIKRLRTPPIPYRQLGTTPSVLELLCCEAADALEQAQTRIAALETASWESWREVNRALVAAGGILTTTFTIDGRALETATLNGVTFDRMPPVWLADEKAAEPKLGG